jgi:hypothetical protein
MVLAHGVVLVPFQLDPPKSGGEPYGNGRDRAQRKKPA